MANSCFKDPAIPFFIQKTNLVIYINPDPSDNLHNAQYPRPKFDGNTKLSLPLSFDQKVFQR